jgi:uncharacterized protein YjbI with pentapeptide repeats
MSSLFAPRLFLSYARADAPLARSVCDALRARGFRVFFDEAVEGGEDYVRRLTSEIERSEALIAVLTPSSVSSQWCVAEWYWAHALRRRVIPIRFGPIGDKLPEPIRLLEERIHFLQPGDVSDYDRVALDLARQLDAVRRSRRRRVALRVAGAGAVLLIVAMAWFGINRRVETSLHNRARQSTIARLTGSAQPLAGSEIARAAASFAGDEQLLGTALTIAADSTRPDPARLNAIMLAGQIEHSGKPEQRWFIRNANWRNGTLTGVKLVDVTFHTGTVDRLTVTESSLGSVHWGRSPAFTLSNSSFRNVQFAGGGFDQTNAIGVAFDDCIFRGTEIDVTNFSLVAFRSSPADAAHPTLIPAGRQTILENCVVVNRATPAAAGVLDLADPAEDVRFTDVVFTGVRFRGFFRPEWFRRCSFDRCTFPTAIRSDDLVARGNTVSDCSSADEPLD